jgi:hypothetical protein
MPRHLILIIVLLVLVSGCAALGGHSGPKQEVTAQSYGNDQTKGLVVLSAIWGRTWKCAQFENGQLRSFGFDRLSSHTKADNVVPEVFLEDSPPYDNRRPINYVLALEPGEYGLATFGIGRARLFEGSKPIGGTFHVSAGELVYIGHFGLDCYKEPTIWRYYPEGRDGFESYKEVIKKQYPFLDMDNMQFRLFKTTVLGRDYVLPQ